MAATKHKKSRGGGVEADILQEKDVVQAIVIADSFNIRFAPMTKKKPRVLLPLVNYPLLEYTLNFLHASGVQIVFLFCSSFADAIKEYINSSKWSQASIGMQVKIILSETCLSMGDALREIDGNSLVRTDFILLSGDVVSNVQLQPILEEHKERRKKDKKAIMTMLYKRAAPKHRTRCAEEETVIAIDSSDKRILHLQKAAHHKKINFPLSIFQDNKEVEICYDLLDCQICICSPDVLPLFSDNFDYQTRDDFVKGILVNEEILGNTIHLHTLEDEYAARISNIQMYDAVSKDIIGRWVYPYVPDGSAFGRTNPYCHLRQNVYLQKDITLARTCVLEENVVIGKGTRIGYNSLISQSVIGCNCVIGDNVKVENAYVWDNVIIEDNCNVKFALLADGVKLKKNVDVSSGCIFSYNVIVGPSKNFSNGVLLAAEPEDDDDGFGDEDQNSKDIEIDKSVVGKDGVAYVYNVPRDSDSDVNDLAVDMWGLTCQSDDDDLSSPDESDIEDASDRDSPMVDDLKMFYNEVLDSLIRGVEENIKCENLILEINSSKYAYNVTMSEVNSLVTRAVFEIPDAKSKQELTAAEYFVALKPVLIQMIPLFRNYIKSLDSQMDCLNSLEDYGCHHENFGACYVKILNMFYEKDILSEEAIMKWFNQPPNPEYEGPTSIRKQVLPLIQWLQEAEEESEDD